jgi:phytoene synthase
MSPDLTVEESYEWCVQVARRQAKNFYYSFLLLSPQQREVIAPYVRRCDDLSDDEGSPTGRRHRRW